MPLGSAPRPRAPLRSAVRWRVGGDVDHLVKEAGPLELVHIGVVEAAIGTSTTSSRPCHVVGAKVSLTAGSEIEVTEEPEELEARVELGSVVDGVEVEEHSVQHQRGEERL